MAVSSCSQLLAVSSKCAYPVDENHNSRYVTGMCDNLLLLIGVIIMIVLRLSVWTDDGGNNKGRLPLVSFLSKAL